MAETIRPDGFAASRARAEAQLREFLPKAGRAYAAGRNDASKCAVSGLSPAIRHRLISEPEVLRAVLAEHAPDASEKFLQEVCWRSYWKGWLEQRLGVWSDYCKQRNTLYDEYGKARAYLDAIAGNTGLACFDDWAKTLNTTGYLHNHVRMWVASIWVFTFKLPWQLGADWFMARLLDGDAASNTLSWRWVAGLQTQGKHYLARAENIHKFTGGQYNPAGQLNEAAKPLVAEAPLPQPTPFCWEPVKQVQDGDLLVLTDDDLSADLDGLDLGQASRIAILRTHDSGACQSASQPLTDYKQAVASATRDRLQDAGLQVSIVDSSNLAASLDAHAAERIVLPWVPVGPNRDHVFDVLSAGERPWSFWLRAWDAAVWPHAKKGFFPFKKRVLPALNKLLA